MLRHALLIAAIFVPYMLLMTALGVHIYRTGRHRPISFDPDGADLELEAGRTEIGLAA